MQKLRLMLALFVAAFTLMAADATGKWSYEMNGRGGNTMTVTMNLKAEGDNLTGTVTGRGGDTPISDGKIDGQTISFNVVREFNGNKMTQAYKGKLDGDTIHFSMTMSGGPMGNAPAREFDAKRQ